MRITSALFTLHLLAFAAPAAALLGIGEKSVAWREEVALRSGKTLLVDRSVTFGADEWFRSGRGGLKTQALSFPHAGRTVKWEGDGGYLEIPLILDIIDGAPVLVAPIENWHTCHRYDFPADGIVAWREERGKWARMDAARLPADLRMNLLQAFSDLLQEPPPRGLVVNAVWKSRLGGRTRDNLGDALAVISQRSREGERACRKMRPAPDPELEATGRRVTQAEKAARTVSAQRGVLSTAAESVSAADVRASLGQWMKAAWVGDDCRGVVKQVEPTYQYSGDARSMRSNLAGYTIHIAAPAGDARIALEGSQPGLAGIACDDRTLLVMRRASGDQVLVDRFDRAGALIDATWVHLPGAAEVCVDPKAWAVLWSVRASGDSSITMVMADYAYTASMGQGGTLRRKATYTATLPAR